MDAPETPSSAPNAACDRPFSVRNSAKVMTIHYHHGNESQGRITALVTDLTTGIRYLFDMNIELDRLVTELCARESIKAAEIARRANIPPSRLSAYRKGKRSMPTKHAAALARVLGVTPFDIEPDFGRELLDTIPNREEREFFRLSLKRTFQFRVRGAEG
jgi:transcriptional regulator with XRE-family HTH domain